MAEIGRLTVFGFATSERSLMDKKDIRVSWGLDHKFERPHAYCKNQASKKRCVHFYKKRKQDATRKL
jgi:hypothetical protein